MTFRIHVRATYTGLGKYNEVIQSRRGSTQTAVFLLYTPHLWKEGPGLIASFAMGGMEGLIWNYLLRTRYSALLRQPRFFIGDMSIGQIPDRPTDLFFARNWSVNKVLDIPIN